jgi:vesicle-fusing ATPase
MGISHVRGMLLHGPPGCGKTLIARQIGKVLNAREPKIVNGPEVLDKYVGASEEKIRDLFRDAEAEQEAEGDASMLHTIIFDEMDAICKSRGSTRDGTGVSDSIVNQLLSKIDGVDSLNNILVIGMTNRKDMIDEAILRPGRLELHVEIGLPDEKGRLQILDIKTASMKKSGRLGPDAVAHLPLLARRTKNFSGAELEGLVKSAASYALRRCVDVSADNAIDDASLTVAAGDFDQALDSGEAAAAFGVKAEALEALYRNGVVDYGPAFRELRNSLDRLVAQTRTSAKTPLMTVLLDGPGATGKTALAARAAVSSEFPFVRLVSADAMIGYSESAKCQHIQKVFLDSYKSPLSLIVIDDVERILEYTPVGPRFSNTVLQTLLVLLKKAPPEENRRLLVFGTTGVSSHLEDLQLVDAFNVTLRVPQLERPDEIEAALEGAVADEAQRSAVAAAVQKPLGIKQLLMILEMARSDAGVDVNDFLACLHTVVA